MSNDKRAVSTDALETLGTIIDNKEKRDAIHLAVIPVEAKQILIPGQDVGVDGTKNNCVGIVDPFLTSPVDIGQYFWLVIYPRKINSLRHVWSHPDIPDECLCENEENIISSTENNNVKESIKWIENYASKVGRGYDYAELMRYAKHYIKARRDDGDPNYLIGGEEMQNKYVDEEFWHHYEIVTGQSLSKDEKESNFFGCSC